MQLVGFGLWQSSYIKAVALLDIHDGKIIFVKAHRFILVSQLTGEDDKDRLSWSYSVMTLDLLMHMN